MSANFSATRPSAGQAGSARWRRWLPGLGWLVAGLILALGLWAWGQALRTERSQQLATRPAFAPVDLALQPWYARQGFADVDRSGFDLAATGVRQIEHFPIHLNELFAIPPGHEVNAFALMTFVDLPPEAPPQDLMLILPELGENWALYLNGVEVRREIFLSANGQMQLRRSLQNVLVPLPATALRPGRNTVVFEMLGQAPAVSFFTDWTPGFSMADGYVIASADELLQDYSLQDSIAWFQIGVYLFFSITHLLLFLRQRERYALYFGLFLFTCATYSFSLSHLAFRIVPDTALLIRLMYISNLGWPALVGLMLWHYLYPGQPTPHSLRGLVSLMGLGAAAMALVPFAWAGLLLNLFLVAFVASSIYILRFIQQAVRRGAPDARKILAAGLAIFAVVVWSIVDLLFVRTGIDLVGWAPFFLAVAFAVIFIDRVWKLARELTETNHQLSLSRDHLEEQVEARSAQLRAANMDLSQANLRLEDNADELEALLAEVNNLNAELEQRVEVRTAELQVARDAAEAANRAKSAFLAVMGHELRTPLNGIFLAAEMLLERHQPLEDQKNYAGVILSSGRRLLQMVEGVLEFSAMDNHVLLEPLDIAFALHEATVRFEIRAARKGLTLALDLAPRLPPVRADARQLDRLLRRVLDNAVKFTPEGGQVTIATHEIAGWAFLFGEKPGLRITITDTGPGLTHEECTRIFEPFVQLEASHLVHAEGAGLGLTLARRQAETLGGCLWAESEGPGQGSAFILMLPCA